MNFVIESWPRPMSRGSTMGIVYRRHSSLCLIRPSKHLWWKCGLYNAPKLEQSKHNLPWYTVYISNWWWQLWSNSISFVMNFQCLGPVLHLATVFRARCTSFYNYYILSFHLICFSLSYLFLLFPSAGVWENAVHEFHTSSSHSMAIGL